MCPLNTTLHLLKILTLLYRVRTPTHQGLNFYSSELPLIFEDWIEEYIRPLFLMPHICRCIFKNLQLALFPGRSFRDMARLYVENRYKISQGVHQKRAVTRWRNKLMECLKSLSSKYPWWNYRRSSNNNNDNSTSNNNKKITCAAKFGTNHLHNSFPIKKYQHTLMSPDGKLCCLFTPTLPAQSTRYMYIVAPHWKRKCDRGSDVS